MADYDVINEDEDMEESLAERLFGLTEMFPVKLRNATSAVINGTSSALWFTWKNSRSAIWIFTSSVVIMIMPYAFEKERADYEERMRQEERNILFGKR